MKKIVKEGKKREKEMHGQLLLSCVFFFFLNKTNVGHNKRIEMIINEGYSDSLTDDLLLEKRREMYHNINLLVVPLTLTGEEKVMLFLLLS